MNRLEKQQLINCNHQFVWHPFTQMKAWQQEEPLFIERGDGNWLIDVDGNHYLDGVSSLWANIHGHNKKELNDAIQNQLQQIAHSTMLGLANIPATLLAEKLVQIAPGKLNKVFYSDSGATAVEIALKMAYQYWQQKEKPNPTKKKFVKLTEAYHGDTIGAVSIGGIDLFHKIFSTLLFDSFDIPTPFYYHSYFSSEKECGDYSIKSLKSLLEKHHHEIAGLFIEPYVQGSAGMIVFPKGFMKEVRTLCSQYNILFIADEVATGFGRTGKMFACEEEALAPDIITVAKGITGGYLPLAATLVTDEIFNAFLGEPQEHKTFFHGHTYTGNPLACNVALASLKIFDTEETLAKLQAKVTNVTELLSDISQLEHVGNIRQKGFMIGIELVKYKITKQPYPPEWRIGHQVCMEARKHQIIIRPLGDVIVLMPPLSITLEELQLLADAITQSIKSITESVH